MTAIDPPRDNLARRIVRKGIDEDSPQAHQQMLVGTGSGRRRLKATAEAIAEFPSELTGEMAVLGQSSPLRWSGVTGLMKRGAYV